jgi:hypothetical protein
MSDQAKDYDLNHGVQIILNRMKTNPEEFFDEGGRWRWVFKDTLREVLTEIEKAAIFEGLKEVRRMEITSKAAATVLRVEEDEKEQVIKEQFYNQAYNAAVPKAVPKAEGRLIQKGSGFF